MYSASAGWTSSGYASDTQSEGSIGRTERPPRETARKRGSARVLGSGAHHQTISTVTQLDVVLSPSGQHGVSGESIRTAWALFLTRNGHVRPLLPTVRLCAIIDVSDEWAPLSEREKNTSRNPPPSYVPGPGGFPGFGAGALRE